MLAVLALGVATAASASASEFVFSKTGTLKGEQVTTQTWKAALGGFFGTIECTKDKASGSTTVLKSATQAVTVQYEGCKIFGVAATATAAEYELNANGTRKLLKAFNFKSIGECKLTFPAQNLSKDTYVNKAGKVEAQSALTMKFVGEKGPGGFCETSKAEEVALYEGASLIELVGGTMEVK